MPEYSRLKIHGYGDIEVDTAVGFLRDFQRAYEALDAFIIYSELARYELGLEFSERYWLRRGLPFSIRELLLGQPVLLAPIPRSDKLILSAVKLSSPGFWEFLGSLHPLEVARKYLNDRHERRKDRDYRESAEKERLRLQNMELQDKIIAERIRMLKEVGIPDSEIRLILTRYVEDPLTALNSYQDRSTITDAELLPAPNKPQS